MQPIEQTNRGTSNRNRIGVLLMVAGMAIAPNATAESWPEEQDAGKWFSAHQMVGDHPHWFAGTLHGKYFLTVEFRQKDCSIAYQLNRMNGKPGLDKQMRLFPELQVRVDHGRVYKPFAILEQDAGSKFTRMQFTVNRPDNQDTDNADLLRDIQQGQTLRFKVTPPDSAPVYYEQRFANIPLNGSASATGRAQRSCKRELSQRDYFPD